MQLSVVILNYNVRSFLMLCLDSVCRAIRGLEAEIIVVDNASSDDSADYVKRYFPQVKWIGNTENVGFPKGNNIGVEHAKGKYLLILNPDTIVPETVFNQLIQRLQQRKFGIVGCRLQDGQGEFLPESKRGIPTPWVAFTKVMSLYKLSKKRWGKYYASHLDEYQEGAVEILVGAFMLMETERYRKLEGFDPNCFMYSDDIDLSYRSLQLGEMNGYCPQVTAVHFKGESTLRDQVYAERFREAMNFFYRKHFKPSFLFNAVMRVGAYLFSLKKRDEKGEKRSPIQHYIYVGKSSERKRQLEELLGKKIPYYVSIAQAMSELTRPAVTAIIWDTKDLSYFDILEVMRVHAYTGVRHRFLWEDLLIGSDSSQDRGQVLKLQ